MPQSMQQGPTSYNANVSRHAPRIFEKWEKAGSSVPMNEIRQSLPSLLQHQPPSILLKRPISPVDYSTRPALEIYYEILTLMGIPKMDVELEATRSELTAKLTQYAQNYKRTLSEKDKELNNRHRIMNIQGALIQKVYDRDSKLLLKILEEANIDPNELKVIDSFFKPKP